MSTVKSKKIQLGTDATSSNNFTIYQPSSPDGTLRIGVGNSDSPTEVARFDATGMISGYPDTTPDALSTATGSAPSYSARAWVNFNGTGTVAIRDSGNVSSITDNGTGNYTVNFTTAMPDTNYSTSGMCRTDQASNSDASLNIKWATNLSTSSFQVQIARYSVGSGIDTAIVCVQVFR